VAFGRQLRPVPAARARRGRRVARPGRPVGARAQLRGLAPTRRLPAGHRRHPRRGRPLPRRPRGGTAMTATGRRTATRSRTTKETDITIDLDLDGSGAVEVATGIPFFDHMLAQLGRHGGFDLAIKARGDLEIDAHHTVEDTGILLGETFADAVGDKAGVR